MLGIILCDDDQFILKIEAERIKKTIQLFHLDARLLCMATDYGAVINFVEANPGIYLYFMDLDFGEGRLNGIDIAKLIKRKEPLSKVVFATSHHEMALEVLKSGVEPFGFIEKSVDLLSMDESYRKYIHLAMAEAIPRTEEKGECIELSLGVDEKISLPLNSILYVESVKTVSHGIAYHTIDGSQLTVRDSIENVLEKLGRDFIKSHRSVIIHKKYVVGVEEGIVRFSNGEVAACSFRLKNEVKKAIFAK